MKKEEKMEMLFQIGDYNEKNKIITRGASSINKTEEMASKI